MLDSAQGAFEVAITPQTAESECEDVGRMLLAKTFSGELEATSAGQMLAFRSPLDGSAGYVAMEVVTGTLAGRRGSFVLQHSGTMDRGSPSLSVSIVPDSGTDDLTGIVGTMTITIESSAHLYELTYSVS